MMTYKHNFKLFYLFYTINNLTPLNVKSSYISFQNLQTQIPPWRNWNELTNLSMNLLKWSQSLKEYDLCTSVVFLTLKMFTVQDCVLEEESWKIVHP